ncbi:MAG: hypothetical protein AAGK78_14595 [Planctomycetota bacterium]
MAKELNYQGPDQPGRKLTPKERAQMKGTMTPYGTVSRSRPDTRKSGHMDVEEPNRFIPAAIMIGVAFVVFVGYGLWEGGIEGAATFGIAIFIVAVIDTILLVAAAFATAAVFGMGFGEFKLAVVQLAAASLLSSAIGLAVPLPFVGLVVFIMLLISFFDLETSEAIAFAVVYFIISVASWIFIAPLVLGSVL